MSMSEEKKKERKEVFRFTHNNYAGTELEDLLECKYIIYGKEIAPTTGTPHLQGFVAFHSKKSCEQVRKILPGCDVRFSDFPEDAIAYCKKDGDYTERGSWSSNKKKGENEKERYKRARESAEQGKFEEIDADIYIRHYGNLKKIRAEKQVQPFQLTELCNVWYYGPPGSGKSSKAFRENPGSYLKSLTKWWDSYNNEDTVIIDDMDPFHKSLAQEFKAWGHHMPFPAEIKGGTLCIRPKKIIVTSNYSIDEVWEDETTRAAMHRRYREEIIVSEHENHALSYVAPI